MYISLFLILTIKTLKSTVIIPFKNHIEDTYNQEHLIEKLFSSNITLSINVGTPYQEIPLQILFEEDHIVLLSSESKQCKNLKCFNYINSRTFVTNDNEEKDFHLGEVESAKRSTDTFYMNSETKIDDIEFLLTKELVYKKSGFVGFRMPDANAQYNLIKQLKSKKMINSYVFFVSFPFGNKKINEGQIIIGEYPHVYDPSKFKGKQMHTVKVSRTPSKVMGQNYVIEIKKIFYGENLIVEEQEVSFRFESEFFRATNAFKDIIEKDFFNKYFESGECQSEILKDFLIQKIYFICKDSINIKTMKPLRFKIENYYDEFVLNPEDLFIKINNNKYIFLVYFEKDFWKMTWTFGYSFFRKYTVFFDQDNKLVGFYNDIKGSSSIFSLLFTFFLIGVIVFLIYSIYLLLKKKKKKIAKELLEDLFSEVTNPVN